MELVIAAVVLAAGIVAGATLYGRRTVATVDGAPDQAAGEGRLRQRERALGLLVRRGYELELAYDAVRALEPDAGPGRSQAARIARDPAQYYDPGSE